MCVEVVDTSQLESKKKRRVARRLSFNACDCPTQTVVDRNSILEECLKEQTARWNFDFVNEVPLKGRYQWERVDENILHTRRNKRLKQKLITDNFPMKKKPGQFLKFNDLKRPAVDRIENPLTLRSIPSDNQ